MGAVIWIDKSVHNSQRTVLTKEELGIPGLQTFGHHDAKMRYLALPDHYHPSCLEMTFIERGTATYNIGEELYELYPGDIFITQPDVIHSSNEIPLSVNSMFWVQLDLNDPDGFLFLSREVARETVERLRNFGDCMLSMNQPVCSRIFNDITKCFTSGNPDDRKTGTMALLYFLRLIISKSTNHDEAVKQTSSILKTFHYIRKHIKEDISMEELAEVANLSVSRFKQKFTLEIGLAPRTFINHEKIESSIDYLLDSHSVTETASEFNFSSSNYYCEVFKRYQGKSPTQYLKDRHEGPNTRIIYQDGINEMRV